MPTEWSIGQVNVLVFSSVPNLIEMGRFLKGTAGLPVEAQGRILFSKEGKPSPLFCVRGTPEDVSRALVAFFESRPKRFHLAVVGEEAKIAAEDYSVDQLAALIRRSRRLLLTNPTPL